MEYSRLVYSSETSTRTTHRTVGIGRNNSRSEYAREAVRDMLHETRRTKQMIYRPTKARWR